jgi:hypothetical protein
MQPASTESNISASLKLSEDDWANLIQRLEASRDADVSAFSDRRDLDQCRYTMVKRAAIRVQHMDGRASSHVIRTRNISCGGVAILHNVYLHPKTLCHVVLMTRHNEGVGLAASVAWCRHLEGLGHEIGLRFEKPIDVTEFVDKATIEKESA